MIFVVGPVGRLEFAKDDEPPVGRMEGPVEFVGAGIPGEVTGTVLLATLVAFADGEAGTVALADVGAAAADDEVR